MAFRPQFLGVVKSAAHGLEQLSASDDPGGAEGEESDEAVTGGQLVAAFKRAASDFSAVFDNFNVSGKAAVAEAITV